MRKLFISILLVLLIQVASANLLISPNPSDIVCKVGTTCPREVTLTNNFDFQILDFKFSNLESYGFTFPGIVLESNTTKIINFTISTIQSYHESIESNIEFKFFVDLPEDITTHYIDITSNGFSPNYIIIRESDTIIWTNKDDISHNVFSSNFNYNIPTNSTIQHIFNTIGTVDYYDQDWYGWGEFEGIVEVINRTSQEKANNPNYDIKWVVNFDSVLNPTNLSIDNSKNSYEVEYGKFKKGLLTIENIGSEVAEVIKLSSNSEWISFNKNDLNIIQGEEDWIEYTITPIMFNTNQTDKNYTIDLKIKASNSEEYIEQISVYVPYKEVTSEMGGSDVDTLNWLQNVFCPAFPTSFLCNQSVIQEGNGTGGYDMEIPINVSKASWYDMKKDLAKVKDDLLRSTNQQKITADMLGITVPQLLTLLNQSVMQQEENEETQKNRTNAIWIIITGIVLIGLAVIIIDSVNKKSFKKSLVEGPFRHKKW